MTTHGDTPAARSATPTVSTGPEAAVALPDANAHPADQREATDAPDPAGTKGNDVGTLLTKAPATTDDDGPGETKAADPDPADQPTQPTTDPDPDRLQNRIESSPSEVDSEPAGEDSGPAGEDGSAPEAEPAAPVADADPPPGGGWATDEDWATDEAWATDHDPGVQHDADPVAGQPVYPAREAITVVERVPDPASRPTPVFLPADPPAPAVDPGTDPYPAPPAEDELAGALHGLRDAIAGTEYPLAVPTAEEARRVATALIAQLDDYLLPRLARLDAPLLVVVGGSTGAGKSTLVNSIVRAPVSAAGVLRPTTRAPVLVCHPNDISWFHQGDLLPGLTRTSDASTDSGTLQLVAAPALIPGLAFLDAPDIDSVVDENRALAAQLLASADLWLFVTSAARYADAVPWDLLRTARLRGTVTALVLDRVPGEAAGEISDHLRQMLAVHGLESAPLFVLPETGVTGQGLLPEEFISPLRRWFERLAADAAARAAVVRQTLDGALAALEPAVDGLAAAADEQSTAAKTLAERVGAAHGKALGTVEHGVRDGTLLRGEVLARWQEFVGTGELLRALEARIGRVRDRVTAALSGRPAPGKQLQTAIESNLVTLIRGAAADAAEQAYSAWQAHPAGAALLRPALGHPSDDLAEEAERLVREWQRGVLEMVRTEGGDRRFVARSAAYAVNAGGLAVMIAVFTSTAFIPTGLEVAAAGGTTVAAQKVLEAVFGDQAIRTLASKAREDLLGRVDVLLEEQATRYLGLLDEKAAEGDPGAVLRAAAEAVERARYSAALTGGATLTLPEGVS